MTSKETTTPGPGSYTRTPLSPAKRLNRSASFGSKTKRFNTVEQEGPAPGQFDAKPGAFAAASQRPRQNSSGFGSRSARNAFPVSKEDQPAPGAYDQRNTGAFAAAGHRNTPSAGFASKSSRFHKGAELGQAGAEPGTYDSSSFHSMAANAGKSFNKASANGAGGFGTSQRRPEMHRPKEETPGPAAYEQPSARSRADARPSSAFASRSKKDGLHFRPTEGPTGPLEYNYDSNSMAAMASKSFNKKVASGQCVSRAERDVTRATARESHVPGPGAYDKPHDPNRPSFEPSAGSRGQKSSWAASTAARTPTFLHQAGRSDEA